MSDAAIQNRAISTGDLKKSLKQLEMMRRRRANLIEGLLVTDPQSERIAYLSAEMRSLETAIACLTDTRSVARQAIGHACDRILSANQRWRGLLREAMELMPLGTAKRATWLTRASHELHTVMPPAESTTEAAS